MEWVERDFANSRVTGLTVTIQGIVLPVDADAFASSIPLPPRLLTTKDGFPFPTNEWNGVIGGRIILAQMVAAENELTIYTPYSSGETADWTVIKDLQELPASVNVARPIFIQSRYEKADSAVYRRDPRGWLKPVYYASEGTEATALLEFLSRDGKNEDCIVEATLPRGKWEIMGWSTTGPERLGMYPDLHTSLASAAHHSKDIKYSEVVVENLDASPPSKVFVLREGRVVDG